jgi:hypothetical protein
VKLFTFLGLIMMVCGAVLLWSVIGASNESRLYLGLVAGTGQILVGIAWIFFGDHFRAPKR